MEYTKICGGNKVVQNAGSLNKNVTVKGIAMLDPRTKIVILLMISAFSFAGSGQLLTESLGIMLIGIIMLLYKRLGSFIKYVSVYFIVFILVLLCSRYHNVWASMIAVMLVMIRKMMSIIMFASFMIATTKVSEMIASLQKINIPKYIITPTVIVLRFFPSLREEFRCIINAMKIRGIYFNLKNIIFHPLCLCEYIIVPMIVRLSIVSDELSAAAVSRGIDSEIQRTSLYDVKYHLIDLIFVILFVVLTIFTFMGGGKLFA